MPELPDVEFFKEYFKSTALAQEIADVDVKSNQILDGITTEKLREKLIGKSFQSAERYGKYLFAKTTVDLWFVMHFGMTGSLQYLKQNDELSAYSRLLILFANDCCLSFNDPRKFGRVSLAASIEDFVKGKDLGPDALYIDYPTFKEIMAKGRGTAKFTLLNQHIIAGIGNIYADEILFQASIHPQAKINQLDEETTKELFTTMKRVLSQAISLNSNSAQLPKSYLIHYRHKGAKCPLDGGEIRAAKVGGRTTYFCSIHQKIPIVK